MPRPVAPLLTALAVLAASLATAVPARAGSGGGHSSSSAADQYIEAIPSGGSNNTPTGPPTGRSVPIQPVVKRAIKKAGGADKAALRALVSSPSLGAPLVGHGRPALGSPIRVDEVSRILADEKVGPGNVVSATFDSGYGAFAVLLAAALLGAATTNVVRAIRRRTT